MLKIGVFVCWCGSNIAATVDVDAVAEAMKNEPGRGLLHQLPVHVLRRGSEDDSGRDTRTISLTGIVVCSCSPRMHEATFRKTAQSAGLNPYMVEIANIREQCSWIHKDKAEGTAKAISPGQGRGCQGCVNDAPLTAGTSPVTKRCSGNRRRYRGHSDRAGHRRRRLRGGYSRDSAPPSAAAWLS